MSIRSKPFGSLHLTGEDARKFHAQITYGRPRKAASESLEQGRPIADALVRNGFAALKLDRRKKVR